MKKFLYTNQDHRHKKQTPTESKILEKGRLVESGLVDLWMKEMGDLAKQENKKRIRKVTLSLGKAHIYTDHF